MSGSLFFLETEDFFIKPGDGEKDMLCHRTQGFSLILFYSIECKFCPLLKSIFINLPKSVNGCTFGIVNVDTNKKLVLASQNTTSPIKFVPFIVFYYNGKAFLSYQGEPNEDKIKNFIIDASKHIQKKQQFSKEAMVKKPPQTEAGNIPAYSIGKPYTSGAVCYLNMVEAYNSTPNSK
jgi:hypothetical protein